MLFRIASGMFAVGLLAVLIIMWVSFGLPVSPEGWIVAILIHMIFFLVMAMCVDFARDKNL